MVLSAMHSMILPKVIDPMLNSFACIVATLPKTQRPFKCLRRARRSGSGVIETHLEPKQSHDAIHSIPYYES